MWEFIHKVILLFLERKSKFKHAEERLERVVKYFEDSKKVNELDIEVYEKKARKNGLAQELVGSRLVSFQLVDFVAKNKNVTNFDTVAKNLAFWDTSLCIMRDEENNIIRISINEKEYKKEKAMMLMSLVLGVFVFVYSTYLFKENLIWLVNSLLIPELTSKILLWLLIFCLLCVCMFLFVSNLILLDLKRIVTLLSKNE
ncbi:hypothetical protein [Acinetobacter ursingii]|uniref:hypothetical protein n=2 Tax=Acinetobacter ursingii TaxID=108980 RepID=UPI00124FB42A|nr:hypothetical protein [Acinetobacter ursingii]MCU4604830.1 hypothetical protein [Acinetobacter ursingii]